MLHHTDGRAHPLTLDGVRGLFVYPIHIAMQKPERKYEVTRPGTAFTFYSLGDIYRFLWRMTDNRRAGYNVTTSAFNTDTGTYINTNNISAEEWVHEYRKYILNVKGER